MDIRVYRISTCHWCDKVEALLKRYNVGFKSIVIDLMEGEEQERAIAEAYHLSKQRSFPVTYIDGACIIGFHESRIRSILKLQAGEDEDKESKIKSAGEISSLTLDGVEYRKTIEELRQWLEREAISHGYKINPDKNVIEEIIIGLARNEKRYRYKACPCRLATGKYQLDCDIICPCSYCFLDVEKNGRCYCTLFVSDRYIAGDHSLPQYVPDSRERDDIREKVAKDVRKEEEASIVDAPYYKVHTKVVGFLQDSADRNKAKVIYEKIVNGLDISSSSVQWGEDTSHVSTTIEDIKVDIKLKQDADSYVYIIACSG
ncbi:MAG TPA: ferredoxin-thioredoxin reductase catalytic domain-containing protein, partial [Candidatus Wujingus californicus]